MRLQSALCAEALGAMEEALRLTTDYLTSRKQFGVTLNTFQALTFRAADMYVALELARSTITWATIVAADEATTPEQLATAASHSALQVSVAGRHIGLDAIQLHGGIGMTAEYAVGMLAAVALALVLLKIVTHQEVFTKLLKLVVSIIGKAGGMLP